ncbi:MAG: hypothetical protein PHG96_08295 [Kiritimatiellae bacterium]|nr:hypothetical protein [Kiritimatiellia bacterium]MDD3545340.1 hypothetical protein [Kiritimatiellia bacterium]MDD4025683.1 hypothetical protein [Kiritimatiellia bacterium]
MPRASCFRPAGWRRPSGAGADTRGRPGLEFPDWARRGVGKAVFSRAGTVPHARPERALG